MMTVRHILLAGSALIALLATPVGLPIASSPDPAFSQGNHAASPQSQSARGRKARKRLVPAVVTPALVRDVRFKSYQDHTRIVLDLQHSTSFTQNRLTNPDRIIIELQNTLLGKTAKDRLMETNFPGEVAIAQPHPRSVTISLDMNAVSDYKLLTLSRPDRLVVDVFQTHAPAKPPAPPQKPAAPDTAPPPAPVTPPPPLLSRPSRSPKRFRRRLLPPHRSRRRRLAVVCRLPRSKRGLPVPTSRSSSLIPATEGRIPERSDGAEWRKRTSPSMSGFGCAI